MLRRSAFLVCLLFALLSSVIFSRAKSTATTRRVAFICRTAAALSSSISHKKAFSLFSGSVSTSESMTFVDKARWPDSKTALPSEKDGSKDIGDDAWREKLTPEEFRVLRKKGTERAHSHPYDMLFAKGTYVCAGCRTPLYTSEMKFDCGCGWPGFWSNIPKAVREESDADGHRVELLCNACNGHLGHVFRNEGFNNPLNERHCVNGVSVKFLPAGQGDL